MKGFQKELFKLVVLLVFAQVSLAQTDLAILNTQNAYQFTGDGQQNQIVFEFDNFGPDLATAGVNVTFTKDMFVDPTFELTVIDQGDYTCTPNGDSINCNYNNTSYDPNVLTSIILGLDIQPGDADLAPAFSVNITDLSGQDSDISNNNIFIDIDYTSAGTDVDLGILKTLTPGSTSPVSPGGNISFDLTVTNLSGFDATNVIVTDDILVNDLQFDAADSSPECTDASSFIECAISSLPSGDEVTFTIATTVQTFATPGNRTNTGSVSALETDPDFNNNTSDQAFTIGAVGGADIEVSKIINGGTTQVVQGTTLEYVIEVNNIGAGDAVNVDLSDTLPTGVTYQSHVELGPNFTCNYSAPTLNCNAPNLPNTANVDGVRITAVVDGAINAVISNTAASAYVDSNPNNNMDTVVFNVIAPDADLSVSIASDQNNYSVGDLITLDVTVDNPITSTGASSNVVVTTTLPAETMFNSANVSSAPGWMCSHDGANVGGDVTCDSQGNVLGVGETTVIQVLAAAVSPTVSLASANVFVTSDFDPTPANDFASVEFDIIPGDADLSITMLSNPDNYDLGETIVYDVQVVNPMGSGSNPADVVVEIDLPVEVNYSNVDLSNAPGWLCTHDGSLNGGLISCDLNGAPFVSSSTHRFLVDAVAVMETSAAQIRADIGSAADNNLINNSVSQSDVINAGSSDFSIAKTVSGNDFAVGDTFTYVLSVSNPAGSTAAPMDVTISDELPAEVRFDSFLVGSNSGTTVNCIHDGSNAGGLFSCNTGMTPFPPGELATIDINVTAIAASNNVDNSATVETASDPDGTSNNNSDNAATVTINNSSEGDFSLTLSSIPQQVNQGENFTHRLTIRNTGNNDITNVSSNYILPQATEFSSISADGVSCNRVSNTFTCLNTQVLAAGNTFNIDFNLVVTDFVGLISAFASARVEGVSKNASTNTQIINNSQNDLSLTKSASVSEISQNEPFTYSFDVFNAGSEAQNSFSLTDQLPAGVVFQSAAGANWSCDGASQLVCQYTGNLMTGSQTQLLVNVLAPNELGVITNTATVDLVGDENPTNNNSSAVVDVIEGQGGGAARADLSVFVEVNDSDVLSTETIIWRINISNSGPDAAENVVVGSTFPVGFMAGNVQVMEGAECILLASSLVCEIAALESGQSNEIIIEGGFTTGFSGLLINAVEVVADTVDSNPSNNIASSEVNVTAAQDLNADLSLELNASNQQVQQGGVVELSFIANNLGPDAAINAQINGSLSGLIENVQLINTGSWLCQINNVALSCSFPGELQVGMQSEISLRVQTQQVVQQSQPISFNASITSDSMDSQPGNNMLAFSNAVTRTPTEDEIFAAFQNSVGSGASETVIQSIRNVSSYCARSYFTAIEGLCEEFIEDATPENGGAIINAMEELTPNEVAAQSNSAAEIITSQFRNVGSRLAQLRGGGGSGISLSGLNGRYGNESIPLGMLAYLNQGEGEEAVSNINDFVSPWGFFVNGSISMGERDATGRELGFDFDTFGVTAGVDYRFSPTKVAGVALGYANFDSDIEGEAQMKSTSMTLTGYGSFYLKDNFYVDARISYGNPDFEQKRRINFEVDDIAIDRVATGETDSNQYSVAMSAGYHFNKNGWNFTPNASIRYVRTTIDAFEESGAGGFNFAFGEQEVKSLVWSVGASVSRAISLKNGVISPQFDFNFSRETENDGGLLEARFTKAPDDEIFFIGTDEPDRTYGDAGLGLVFIGANGKQAYINYRSIFGLEGFSRGTINVGARFEF